MKKIAPFLIILLYFTSPFFIMIGSGEDFYKMTSSKNEIYFESISQGINLHLQDQTIDENNIGSNIKYIEKSISVSLDDISFQNDENRTYTLQLNDSIPFNQPGLPLIPMRTISFSLPKDTGVSNIIFKYSSIKKCIKPVIFQKTPTPSFWSINETPLHDHIDEIISTTIQLYQNDSLYPGTTHSYITGKNNTNTTVIIHFFPIQYDLQTKETYLVTNGNLTLYYQINENISHLDVSSQDEDVENIIISPPQFYMQAQSLKQFHDQRGTSTEIITTTWINARFKPAEYPSVAGYKDFSFGEKIPKYKDVLARKIISFLQSQTDNSNLKFITILGNGRHVPPSYYFGEAYYPVPTDFYYSSPDLDLIPNLCVGRLPVNTIIEAGQVVKKIINWNPSDGQMDHIAIAGGIPFDSPFYIGELITIDSVNSGFFDGITVDKYYRSDERFEKNDILTALGKDYGLLYSINHGSPFLIAAEEGLITTKDIQKMKKSTNQPIFSCIACSSGSFDTQIIRQGIRFDKTSFGESIVISKGGAIAYIGGSRTNDGSPLFTINKGRVEIEKETYMAGLLTYVNKAYTENVEYLGELTKGAAEIYLLKNDMDDFWNKYHYFSFVLLGDPALQLPLRTGSDPSYEKPFVKSNIPMAYFDFESSDNEDYGLVPFLAIDEETVYVCFTDSPGIRVKYLKTGTNENIPEAVEGLLKMNNISYYFMMPLADELILLRFEADDGKEEWVYFKPIRPIDDDFNESVVGFQETRWANIQEAVDSANPGDPLFVFNGTYCENVIIDKPLSITGEHPLEAIIDGKGYDNVLTILSDGVMISDLTIEHCGKQPDHAAVYIEPKRTWNPKDITIQYCRIQNNLNNGIFIDISSSIMSPVINLYGNTIQYNNYGLCIKSGLIDKSIYSNIFYGNNYGIYMENSQNDQLFWNRIENNGVGLFLNNEKNMEAISNGFIENDQDCQFVETKRVLFDQNYWDHWIGHLFRRQFPIPKIINGIHDPEEKLLPQIKIDRHPSKLFLQNADFLKNYL